MPYLSNLCTSLALKPGSGKNVLTIEMKATECQNVSLSECLAGFV
jgi:hypothetical protein